MKNEVDRCGCTDRKMIYLDDAIDAIKALWNDAPSAQHVSAMFDCEDAIRALPPAQPEIIYCKECKYCEHWYADKGRCFLWHEDGIDVFEDGFCNYAERRTDERSD